MNAVNPLLTEIQELRRAVKGNALSDKTGSPLKRRRTDENAGGGGTSYDAQPPVLRSGATPAASSTGAESGGKQHSAGAGGRDYYDTTDLTESYHSSTTVSGRNASSAQIAAPPPPAPYAVARYPLPAHSKATHPIYGPLHALGKASTPAVAIGNSRALDRSGSFSVPAALNRTVPIPRSIVSNDITPQELSDTLQKCEDALIKTGCYRGPSMLSFAPSQPSVPGTAPPASYFGRDQKTPATAYAHHTTATTLMSAAAAIPGHQQPVLPTAPVPLGGAAAAPRFAQFR